MGREIVAGPYIHSVHPNVAARFTSFAGLYLIKGDNVCVIGKADTPADEPETLSFPVHTATS